MQLEMVSGLLLPVGLWLILSAGVPVYLQRRLAACALIMLALALLVFVAVGFALMHAEPDSLFAFSTFGGQRWLLAGSRGFFLQGATPEALARFVTDLPLVWSCALLMTALLAHRARIFGQTLIVAAACGLVLPVAGCWTWGGGWLQSLDAMSGLSLGTADLSRLSTLGLVAGTISLAWLTHLPKRERREGPSTPEMPAVELPARTVAGVLCTLIATAGFAQSARASMLTQFINTSVVVSIAIIAAGGYAIFTTRRPDALSAARAALAAVFVTSAGGALLPAWLLVVLGVGCGLLATIGYYAVNERHRWPDEHALITSVFVPSIVGMIAAGLVQMTATGTSLVIIQVITAALISASAWLVVRGLLAATGRLGWTVLLPADAVMDTPVYAPSIAEAVALPGVVASPAPASASVPAPPVTAGDGGGEARTVDGLHEPTRATRSWSLPRWLRRKPAEESTQTPRKVAYPYRVAGRRVAARPTSRGQNINTLGDAHTAGDSGNRGGAGSAGGAGSPVTPN